MIEQKPLITLDQVFSRALEWVGTPWKHNQSTKGVGADCVGFLWGLGTELGIELPPLNNYSRIPEGDGLINHLDQLLIRQNKIILQPGICLAFNTFNIKQRIGNARHVGLLINYRRLIHAVYQSQGTGSVIVNNIGKWEHRIVAAYKLPGVEY